MANRYWVQGTGLWSDSANHWSASSGGSPGAPPPDVVDDVIIDSNSGFSGGGTLTINFEVNCHNFSSISGNTYTISAASNHLLIYGSIALESGVTLDGVQVYFLSTNLGETITSNNFQVANNTAIQLLGVGGEWTLQDDFAIDGEFYQENGTFNANNHNLTASNYLYFSDIGFTPTVNMGSGTWLVTSYDNLVGYNVWKTDENNGQTITFNPGTSTIKFTGSVDFVSLASYQNGIIGAGHTYNDVWYSGTNDFNILGTNIVNNYRVDSVAHGFSFSSGLTTTFLGNFVASGVLGHRLVLSSDNPGVKANISKASGVVSCDYLDISDSNATGGALWYAGDNSLDTSNNSGWLFRAFTTTTSTSTTTSSSSTSTSTSTSTSSSSSSSTSSTTTLQYNQPIPTIDFQSRPKIAAN